MEQPIRQFRITTENIVGSEPGDCILPDGDAAHELIAANFLGGLGYRAYLLKKVQDEYRKKLEKINENRRNRPDVPK